MIKMRIKNKNKERVGFFIVLIFLLNFLIPTVEAIEWGKRTKVLVTGFGPFDDWDTNPTLEIIEKLDGKRISGAKIYTVALPVTFNESGAILVESIRKIKPDIVISLGLASGRPGISIERVAINIADARIPDENNFAPVDIPIKKNGENAYFSSIPIKKIVTDVREEGIPCYVSNTAGTFMCNYIMYLDLYYSETQGIPKKAGFIHVPNTPPEVTDKQIPSMSHDVMRRAVEIAIECAVEDLKKSGG
jgi:pyroglutamyl-peptidase